MITAIGYLAKLGDGLGQVRCRRRTSWLCHERRCTAIGPWCSCFSVSNPGSIPPGRFFEETGAASRRSAPSAAMPVSVEDEEMKPLTVISPLQ
jgi:hypothetical protein